jgi:Tol biopolymer transport system component
MIRLEKSILRGGLMSTLKFSSRHLVAIAWMMTVIFLTSSHAWATYPGKNGRIVFVGNFTGIWQLFTVNPDGTELFQVTNLPQTELFPSDWFPDFSPDGRRIVFSHDLTGATELYVINVDGTGLTQVTADGAENLFPHWSPDGTRILFAAQFIGDRFDYHHIASIKSDGTDRQTLTDVLFDDVDPQYTIDGKILFRSTRGNLISALWLMNADGSQPRRITEPALEAGQADVSPDGRHMVFANQTNTERIDNLIVSNLDGTQLTKITARGFFLDPVYSPDGNEIVFGGAGGELDPLNLYTIKSDGSGLRLLLACPNSCWVPDWGPKPRLDQGPDPSPERSANSQLSEIDAAEKHLEGSACTNCLIRRCLVSDNKLTGYCLSGARGGICHESFDPTDCVAGQTVKQLVQKQCGFSSFAVDDSRPCI